MAFRASEIERFYEATGREVPPSIQQQAEIEAKVQESFQTYVQSQLQGEDTTPEDFGIGTALSGTAGYSEATQTEQFLSDFNNGLITEEDFPNEYGEIFDAYQAEDSVLSENLNSEQFITSSFDEQNLISQNVVGTRPQEVQTGNAVNNVVRNVEQTQASRNQVLNLFGINDKALFEQNFPPTTMTYSAALGKCLSRQSNGTGVYVDD